VGLVLALGLAVGGFLLARELGDRSAPGHTAVAPGSQTGAATTAAATGSATTTTATTTTATTATARSSTAPAAPPPRPAPSAPVVSWRARPGIRHYRLDVLRGGAVILTILTDAPRTKIPSSWPNAGRVRRLSRGTYEWTVRAATPGPSRRLAHGTFSVH
jgi:hypothetical protein